MPLVLAASLVSVGALRAGAPSQCAVFPANGSPAPDLQAQETDRLVYPVPVGAAAVSGAATVSGHPGWALFFDNHTGSPVTHPRVSVASGLDPSVFAGGLPTPSFPTSCGLPSLGSGQEMQIFPGLNATGVQSGFNLGYNSSISVSPSAVPVGGGNVTATFTLELTDARFAGGAFANLSIGQGGNGPATLISQSGPSNLDQGENVSSSPGNFGLGGLQLDKTYVFTAVYHVANPPFGQLYGPWTWTPSAQFYVNAAGGGCHTTSCGIPGSSVTIADPTLDGGTPGSGAVTFSVDQTDRLWDVSTQTQYETDYPGGQFGDLNAQVSSGFGLGASAATNSVSSGTVFQGQWNWGFDLQNFQAQNNATNATISVASGYAPSQFQPNFGPPASSLPIIVSEPSLPGSADLNLGLGSTIDGTFQSGCDTSRSVSPLTVPVGGGNQTVTFAIRCVDPAVANVNGGVQHLVPGSTLVSFTPPSNLNQGEVFNGPPNSWFGAPNDVSAGFGIGIQNLVTGKQYTFTFVTHSPNSFGVPFAQTPDIGLVQVSPQPTGCLGCGPPQDSITVAEPTLDGPTPGAGTVTFSTGEPHLWNVSIQHTVKVEFEGTAQDQLDFQGPASGVDGQSITLGAFWADGQAQDGTTVTFSLGSQSCTAATIEGNASCTIALSQPLGSYTLQIASPGNVSVYPTDASASFAITGPTSTDQCKNGGWKVFGIFKNQGDCVSYVATQGKNPPAG